MVFQSEVGNVQLSGNDKTLTIDATDWATIKHLFKLPQIKKFSAKKMVGLTQYLDQKVVLKVQERNVLTLKNGSLTSVKILGSLKLAFYRLFS